MSQANKRVDVMYERIHWISWRAIEVYKGAMYRSRLKYIYSSVRAYEDEGGVLVF